MIKVRDDEFTERIEGDSAAKPAFEHRDSGGITSAALRCGDACLTWVSGSDLRRVADAFGADRRTRRLLSWDQLTEVSSIAQPLVGLRTVGDWVLAVEPNGWEGSRPEVLRPASGTGTGTAVSCYWNLDVFPHFALAREGTMETEYEDEELGNILVRAEQETGLTLTPELLSGKFEVLAITPRAPDVPSTVDVLTHQLTGREPTLAYHLARASEVAKRVAARQAARQVIALSDLSSSSAARAALAHEPPQDSPVLQELQATTSAALGRTKGGRPPIELSTRYYAVTALREACSPDPTAAAFGAIERAVTGTQSHHRSDALLTAVRDVLGNPPPPAGSLSLVAQDDGTIGSRYRWIAQHWLAGAGALVVVPGPEPIDPTRALGPDFRLTHTGIPEMRDQPTVGVRTTASATLLLDTSARTGLSDTLLAELSTPDRPVLWVRWSARGMSRLSYAADGVEKTFLDPIRPALNRRTDTGILAPHLRDFRLPFRGTTSIGHLPVLLTVFERLTGVAFSPAHLDLPWAWWQPATADPAV